MLKLASFIIIAGVLLYLFIKFCLYLYRPFFLSRTFREIEQKYNRLLAAVEKDIASALDDLRQWRSGDAVLKTMSTEERIMERVNIAKQDKAHEEEVHEKFLRLKDCFVLNYEKLAESIVVYRRYLDVRLKRNQDAAMFADAVSLGVMSLDEMMAAGQETMIVLEENERKLDLLLGQDEFPKVKWEMKFRKVAEQTTQESILEKIREQTRGNPRIAIAIDMLRTYLHVRPMELLSCNVAHLDLANGVLVVPTTKCSGP